ncbi:MAG: D-alanyl-D-alanine carboxypeptidase family protein, partial [Oscillospiraceae bacterium]|nr:D-alanyl-D-alanine carboxypeptidase family protein [Oscillospiraceae bacterium]
VAVIVLVALIFLLGSCVSGCSRNEEDSGLTTAESEADTASQTAPAAPETTPPPANAADASMVKVPIVITDSDSLIQIQGGESSASDSTVTEPVPTLPAGYQMVPVKLSAMYAGTLVLVNQENPSRLSAEELDLEQVYYAEDKPDTYEISYPGHTSLNRTALSQFNRLMKSYYSATSNQEIMFNYGYLDTGKEKSNPDSPSAYDIQLHIKRNDGGYEYISNISPYSWLFEHMASYGFVIRYPQDKSEITGERGGYTAIRYVGVPHASYMTENNLCLEEYLDQLKTRHHFFGGAPLEHITNKTRYLIYYVPVDSTATGDPEIPVPTSGSYEISGNNSDGFIVTAIVG